jgi:long-chain acyl-CoA synthetase
MAEPIGHLIAAVADRVPAAVALTDRDHSLTYYELQREFATRRATLADLVRPDRVVAIIAEATIDSVLDVLSLLSVARSLCLIDASLPADEQQRLIDHAGADVVVGRRSAPRNAAAAKHRGPAAVTFFTSGTTGFPKAVVHSHHSLLAAVFSTVAIQLQSLGDDSPTPVTPAELIDALEHHATSGHDLGLVLCSALGPATIGGFSMLLRALLTGATFVVAGTSDPERVLDLIEQRRPTNLGLSPFMAQGLVRRQHRVPRDTSSLLLIGVGAGPAPRSLIGDLEDTFDCLASCGYGLTETGGVVTFGRPTDTRQARAETVGAPVPGAEVRIDTTVEPTLVDSGELLVRTPAMMRGYLLGPGRIFRGVVDDDGWFRTGDRARLRTDGTIELHGRLSELIIRGGWNIDPIQVEHVLEAHDSVECAFVYGTPSRIAGEEDVHAAVVPSRHASIDVPTLRQFCAQVLPSQSVPSRFRTVPDLPRAADGSVRRLDARLNLSESTR